MTLPTIKSPNFAFLDSSFALFAILAERYVFDDSNTSLIKLRQFADLLARDTSVRAGLDPSGLTFEQTISMLKRQQLIPPEVRGKFWRLFILMPFLFSHPLLQLPCVSVNPIAQRIVFG